MEHRTSANNPQNWQFPLWFLGQNELDLRSFSKLKLD